MTARQIRVPGLQHHKASGQAKVRLRGRHAYLGKWGTPEADAEYRRVVGEYLINGQAPPPPNPPAAELSVNELAAAFMRFAETHYVKNGRLTDEYACYKSVLRPLKALYGFTPISQFGPVALKAVRQRMIESGWTRRTINNSVIRLRHMFKWGVENELVSPLTLQALQAVQGLQAGRCAAPDPDPVEPVLEATVEATLAHLSPMVTLTSSLVAQPADELLLSNGFIVRDISREATSQYEMALPFKALARRHLLPISLIQSSNGFKLRWWALALNVMPTEACSDHVC